MKYIHDYNNVLAKLTLLIQLCTLSTLATHIVKHDHYVNIYLSIVTVIQKHNLHPGGTITIGSS
jgi:hypothetical protein